LKIKPTRKQAQELIVSMKANTRSRTPVRTDFAIKATLCLINEGIDPSVTMGMQCRSFNLAEQWVEFIPWRAAHIVRRPLSDETAAFLTDRIQQSQANPDALLCLYKPKQYSNRRLSRTVGESAAKWLRYEIELAGYDGRMLDAKALKWIWVDEHPALREQEMQAQLLADIVLRYPKDFQKEGLLKRIYDNTPVLRPSWAYPEWHTNAVAGSLPKSTDAEGCELPNIAAAQTVHEKECTA